MEECKLTSVDLYTLGEQILRPSCCLSYWMQRVQVGTHVIRFGDAGLS